jgi:hypothetical protein
MRSWRPRPLPHKNDRSKNSPAETRPPLKLVNGMPGVEIYVASKNAVIGLTKSAALEYLFIFVAITVCNTGKWWFSERKVIPATTKQGDFSIT